MSELSCRALFRVIHPGPRTSLQDTGRRGTKAMGIPPGGAMDLGILTRLNQLFDQPANTAAYEMLWAGLQLECLRDTWIAYGGAAQGFLDSRCIAAERTIFVKKGQNLQFQSRGSALWSYLSVAGGWRAEEWFGSRSVWPEGGMGRCLCRNDLLSTTISNAWKPPEGVAARFLIPHDHSLNQPIRVYQGPQWQEFPSPTIHRFFETTWKVSIQSNRAGFRLQGEKLAAPAHQLISEPTLTGSIQIPPDGQPIVLLNDGPTTGGYHKIAVIHRDDLDRFRQSPPGQQLCFHLIS